MSKQIIVSDFEWHGIVTMSVAVTTVVGTLVMSYYKISISSNLPKLSDGKK